MRIPVKKILHGFDDKPKPRRHCAQRLVSVSPMRMDSIQFSASLILMFSLLLLYIVRILCQLAFSFFFFSAKKSFPKIEKMDEETFLVLLQQRR